MKIEMGESLMYSWLRHVKECQLVQTNWKSSQSWNLSNKELLTKIMNITAEYYSSKYGMDIFRKSSLEQLLKQAEVDVIGISFSPEPFIYGIDIAFHENGLMYGNKLETAEIVIKKYIRTLMCIIGYFNFTEGEIIFASPKINKNVSDELLPKLNDLSDLIKSLDLNFNIKFFANEDFHNALLSPIMLHSVDVSDTSELFIRSYQMIRLFDNSSKIHKKNENTSASTDNNNEYINASAFDELKIGKCVQLTMEYMMLNNQLNENIINSLTDKTYSNNTFGIGFPMLKDITNCADKNEQRKDTKGYYRYYSTPLKYNNKTYLLCQEWNDRLHREKYDNWYKNIIKLN